VCRRLRGQRPTMSSADAARPASDEGMACMLACMLDGRGAAGQHSIHRTMNTRP
jgi:hypothetical protein